MHGANMKKTYVMFDGFWVDFYLSI